FAAILKASERVTWTPEDLIGPGQDFDFSKPFMPEGLARCAELDFLSAGDRTLWNQLRGHQYLWIFVVAEEFILQFVLAHARPMSATDGDRARALLGFASEEVKHTQLFQRFRARFQESFGHRCDVIGPPEEIARAVLAHPQLSVALAILLIEWMTQGHYLDSVRDAREIDPRFQELLRCHWMEEAQHAKLDEALVLELAAGCTPAEIAAAIDGLFSIATLVDGGVLQQLEFDVDAFERARGARLSPADRERLMTSQRQAVRWTFLGSGMRHPRFLATLGAISPEGRRRVEEATPAFS
ncbi:MAG: diiron oxygenase, partial [Planctomycetes bacterium]|nr:diiron oxygenase [Planctomycetota bacterium]